MEILVLVSLDTTYACAQNHVSYVHFLKHSFKFNALTLNLDTADVNECSDGLHSCEQMCNNTQGSYQCLCFDGYELTSDGYSCQGEKS